MNLRGEGGDVVAEDVFVGLLKGRAGVRLAARLSRDRLFWEC